MFENVIVFLLLFKKIIFVYNYVVLPIYTLKKENYKSSNINNSSIRDIIFSEFYNSLYTELEIGIPSQKIPLLVRVKTNDYVITSIHKMKKNASKYYTNKTVYNFSATFLKKYNFFDENKSNSYSCKYCRERKKK